MNHDDELTKAVAEAIAGCSDALSDATRAVNEMASKYFYNSLRGCATCPSIVTESTLFSNVADDGKTLRVGDDVYVSWWRVASPQFTFDVTELRVFPNKLKEFIVACVKTYVTAVQIEHEAGRLHVVTPPSMHIAREAFMITGYAWGHAARASSETAKGVNPCYDGGVCNRDVCGAASICVPIKTRDDSEHRQMLLEEEHGGRLMRIDDLPARYAELRSWAGKHGSNMMCALSDKLRVMWYTAESQIRVTVRLPVDAGDSGYIDAVVTARAPLPGEAWTRSRALTSGPYCRETWQSIVADAAFCDTLPIAVFNNARMPVGPMKTREEIFRPWDMDVDLDK